MVQVRFTSKSEDDPKERDWLNPIAMHELQRAMEAKKKEVVLNGVRFRIERGHWFNYRASGSREEAIKLKRVDGGYVPFGYVGIKKILDFDFESDV